MLFKITVLTFSNVIPVGSSSPSNYAPWANSTAPVNMSQATRSEITLSDEDSFFESGRYSPEETDQRLAAPATFGYGLSETTLLPGTQLSNFIGSVMSGPTRLDAAGTPVVDQFVMVFPRTFVSGGLGAELGDRHSVLVLPVPRLVDGVQVYPKFDQNLSYSFSKVRSMSSTDDNVAYAAACFGHGTRIRTATDFRPVESLQVGDLVATLDHGLRPILWIGSRLADPLHLDLRPQDRPVLIAAGALGDGQPRRDMMVSPQHRVLIRSPIVARMFGNPEALVAARHLVGQPGILVRRDVTAIRYWHILVDGHDIIDAEGAWTESLYPGPVALLAYSDIQRRQIRAALPRLADGPLPFARPVPGGRQVRQMLARHQRNGKPLITATEPVAS
ncbi:Hint domain-containing protein [Paracoccus beibuensis]|uniref:Hint domain-containing protein n=1 Tax=Paracoccus beibuensis TaxID=547602 RepID=UPI0022408110|nr:Hint domain-containing protein [Paracoccus beibuensis]